VSGVFSTCRETSGLFVVPISEAYLAAPPTQEMMPRRAALFWHHAHGFKRSSYEVRRGHRQSLQTEVEGLNGVVNVGLGGNPRQPLCEPIMCRSRGSRPARNRDQLIPYLRRHS
jgi:hypothetical protein